MTKVRDFLGPYRLARLIRMGSSCQVWEAIKEGDQQRYALKVLRNEFRGNKEELGYLKNEYAIGSTLNHPRIIKMYEFVTDAETPFLVLELFSELNMKQALREGPDPIAYIVEKCVEYSAEALSYLHTRGYLHCDLKPDNLLVDREGEMKLIDFTIAEKQKKGLSKLFGGRSQVRGTRSYMSPEQIRGKVMDPRSDIYSFGCVLFELVTGRPPYTGDTPNALLNKHLQAPIPSVLVHNSNVSDEFAGLIKRMMAKQPNERPETMWEFLKKFRGMKLFKKAPRVPEVSIFDSHPAARTRPEDMFKT
ncbi:MAG: serine/threonine protein kinase [Planctomycetales bacterium]|nr:serine/threonine protein kinase [Planctomycetales bacterium]MCA9162121.1 serine/threonine protein kinase [Planctomycetales bacterium]